MIPTELPVELRVVADTDGAHRVLLLTPDTTREKVYAEASDVARAVVSLFDGLPGLEVVEPEPDAGLEGDASP